MGGEGWGDIDVAVELRRARRVLEGIDERANGCVILGNGGAQREGQAAEVRARRARAIYCEGFDGPQQNVGTIC